jgi:hypothetical protein
MTNTGWTSTRDKYGRTNYELWAAGEILAIVVVLPKSYAEKYPLEGRYLIQLRVLPLEWDAEQRLVNNPLQGRQVKTLNYAKAWAESTVEFLRAVPGELALANRDQLLVARRDAAREVTRHEGRLTVLDRLGVEADSSARVEPTEDLAHALNRLHEVEAELAARDRTLAAV